MPLVQIDGTTAWDEEELVAAGDAVQEAMVAELGVPEHDRFQLLGRHEPARLRFDTGYVGRQRSERFLLVRITLSAGRPTEAKRAFYRALLARLQQVVGLRPDDLAIVLTENTREDWSFGGGVATYLELPREEWR